MNTEIKKLAFRNLPFKPVKGQVIYMEQSYDEEINTIIRKNYQWLKEMFDDNGLEFCFLPVMAEEAVAENASYLNIEELANNVKNVPSLADYLAVKEEIAPCLVFALNNPITDKDGNTILYSLPIMDPKYIHWGTFNHLADEIHDFINKSHYVGEEESFYCRYSIETEGVLDAHSQQLIYEIRQRVTTLKSRGVNRLLLHNLIDEGEELSRLRITKDFRLFLVDHDNTEIKMPVLPKSVFLLFLRHPEGIRFKVLSDYYSELLQIYLSLNPNGSREKHEQSIRDITDPFSNSINEKCARIREAFVANFDDRLAMNYYITGKRGEAKRITLDRSKIVWDDIKMYEMTAEPKDKDNNTYYCTIKRF